MKTLTRLYEESYGMEVDGYKFTELGKMWKNIDKNRRHEGITKTLKEKVLKDLAGIAADVEEFRQKMHSRTANFTAFKQLAHVLTSRADLVLFIAEHAEVEIKETASTKINIKGNTPLNYHITITGLEISNDDLPKLKKQLNTTTFLWMLPRLKVNKTSGAMTAFELTLEI